MKWVRKGLIWFHRYLGIGLSLLFVVWFLSGIGMIFARGMPGLSPDVRLQRLPEIDLTRILLSASEASADPAQDGGGRGGGRVSIGAFLDRPVYRVSGRTVFADDGTVLESVDADTAILVASRFMGVAKDKLHHSMLTEVDQWTLAQRGQIPLHKITVDDDSATHLYISPENGDVLVLTTRGSRALAWVAAIPHWLYFKSLRLNQPVWYQVVVWAAVLGSLLALAGIVLSITQLKVSRPFKLSKITSYIPYSGLMRWHYITGVVFGVLTFTWVFSGLLSMEPLDWAGGRTLQGNLRGALTGGALNAGEFPRIDAATWKGLLPDRKIKEIEYTRIQGDPYFVVRSAPMAEGRAARERLRQEYSSQSEVDPDRVLIDAKSMQVRTELFSVDSLMTRVRETFPDVPILESELLSTYDSYYYSRDLQRPLPVLRIKFGDEVGTWMYLDPRMSQQVAALHRLDRVERWIYNGFHSLDFSFWYYSPVWTVGVIILSIGGAAVSMIGMYLGFRRMGRGARKIVAT